MFRRNRVRLDAGLYRKAATRAGQLGYADVDEFVTHVLERELDKPVGPRDDQATRQVIERLKGLGYL